MRLMECCFKCVFLEFYNKTIFFFKFILLSGEVQVKDQIKIIKKNYLKKIIKFDVSHNYLYILTLG